MKVTIIIPTLDGDRDGLTQHAIASAQTQDGFTLGVDYEVIVQQGDFFLGKNVNDAVKIAKGKYIKVLADDDLLTPNCLKDLYEKAEEGYDLVCADAMDFEASGRETLHKSRLPLTVSELAEDNPFHGGTFLYRKETMPLFDEDMHTAEEYEHTLRMAVMGLRFGYVNKVVYRYRLHGSQKSGFYWLRDAKKKMDRYSYIQAMQNKYITNYNKIWT